MQKQVDTSSGSFPFPPGTLTPKPSIVLLADAIYDQLPHDPDGRIRLRDAKDLIRQDQSGNLAFVLGLSHLEHENREGTSLAAALESSTSGEAPATDTVEQMFSAYGSNPGVKISRDDLKETLQTRASLMQKQSYKRQGTETAISGESSSSLHLPPIGLSDSPSMHTLKSGGSSLLLPTSDMQSAVSMPMTPNDSIRSRTPRSVRDSPVPPLPKVSRTLTSNMHPKRSGLLPPPPPKNPPPKLPARGKHTVTVMRTPGSAPKSKRKRGRRSSPGAVPGVDNKSGGNYRPDARGRYAEVLQEDPNNIDALEHIGYFFVKSRQPKKALDALNRAHRLGCDNCRLWESTGRAHFLLWRRRWMKLETDLGSTEIALKRILDEMPGEAHLETSYQAYERCTKFSSFNPGSNFWFELANVYFHYGAYEGTLAMLANLTRDDPNFHKLSEVIAMVGTVYFRMGEYEKSIHCWKRVLHAPPEHMKERHVMFILARLHELNGDHDSARACFEEVYDYVRKFNLQVSAEQYSRVKSTREYIADADTWLDHARILMKRGYYLMVQDALRVALDKATDQDASLGVLNYPKEKLKEIWVAMARSHCFRLEPDEALHALVKAQEARPYDFYVRESLMDIDPEPEKWSDLFVMESAYALVLTRLVRGFLERQRLRREMSIMGAAATKMARIFRGVRWRIRLKGLYLQLVERRTRVRKRRNWAILKMQSIGRMIKMRNEFIDYKEAAIVISSAVRGMIGRTKALRRRNEIMEAIRKRNNNAAILIQACARGFALR